MVIKVTLFSGLENHTSSEILTQNDAIYRALSLGLEVGTMLGLERRENREGMGKPRFSFVSS